MFLLGLPRQHYLIGPLLMNLKLGNLFLRESLNINIPLIVFHEQPFFFPHQVILIVEVNFFLLFHILFQPHYILVIEYIDLEVVLEVLVKIGSVAFYIL